jgi:hypothetical protein
MLLLRSTMARSNLLVGSKVVKSVSLLREGDRSELTAVLVPSLIRDKAEVVLLLRTSGAVVVEMATKGGHVRLCRTEVLRREAVGQGLLFQEEEVKLFMLTGKLKEVGVLFDEGKL